MFCAEQVVQLHRHQSDISERGGVLVIIGNGAPNFITGFREQTGYRGPLYTDPSLESYRALNLKRTVGSSLNPKTMGRAVTALRHGFRQKKTQGDSWQQGGIFVVSPDDEVHFAFRAQFAGDMPELATILQALEAAKGPVAA